GRTAQTQGRTLKRDDSCRTLSAGIHMVSHVERLSPDLQRHPLANPELPCQAHVEIDESGTSDVLHTDIPIGSRGRLRESCGVEVLVTAIDHVNVGKHLIWSI